MTPEQLSAVLTWQYPMIEKAYSIQDGMLVFELWLDHTTGLISDVPRPTLSQCENWASSIPADPDWPGFTQHCMMTIMGGNYTVINPLLAQYPCFEIGIRTKNSAMLRAEIARARADNVSSPTTGINATLEAAILTSAATYHIPVLS